MFRSAGTKCLSSQARSAFHRAHAVCFIAPEIFSVLWLSGRERTPRPFRGFLIYRSEKFLRFLTRRTREGTSTVPRLIFVSLFTLCLQKSNALPAVRSACCLIACRKFSADFIKAFSASCIRMGSILTPDRPFSSPFAQAPKTASSKYCMFTLDNAIVYTFLLFLLYSIFASILYAENESIF